MARENIDDPEWGALEYRRLGRLSGCDEWSALARFHFLRRHMTERFTPDNPRAYEITRDDLLDLHPDLPNFFDAMIAAGLGTSTAADRMLVHRTGGHIEWLYEAKENGKKGGTHGAKGGRPPKNPPRGSEETPRGVSPETPGGPPSDSTLALALKAEPPFIPPQAGGEVRIEEPKKTRGRRGADRIHGIGSGELSPGAQAEAIHRAEADNVKLREERQAKWGVVRPIGEQWLKDRGLTTPPGEGWSKDHVDFMTHVGVPPDAWRRYRDEFEHATNPEARTA